MAVADNEDFMRFLASWALVHETADEGWKSAVARGNAQEPGDMDSGSEAFVDGLSAIIAERKETLKAELAAGAEGADMSRAGVSEHLDELRFEVAELRGRFESMQASLDAILERTKAAPGDGTAGKA
jgi:predicted aminopeptidase